jgi:D-arabinose 1-dehydrogenase-like Zn-dependent alcohol dehydrogenase
MPRMRAAQVVSAKGPYQIVEREIPEPAAGQVRIRVFSERSSTSLPGG